MILFPPAKINLGLRVLRKREDGYHEIETCMVAIPLCDVLEILPAKEFMFSQSGLKVDSVPSDNLCVQAFNRLDKEFNLPAVHIHLLKNIPMGAGLGGGSADATYVLKGLNTLFNLGLSEDRLRSIAAELGSDCPFFVAEIPQIATGRGEELSPFELNLSGYYLKIVNPGIHVSTAEAYANVVFDTDKTKLSGLLAKPISEWKSTLHNSFEDSIFPAHPAIKIIKESMYAEGAVYAAMSGSGSTVFGIFTKEPSADGDGFVRVLRL